MKKKLLSKKEIAQIVGKDFEARREKAKIKSKKASEATKKWKLKQKELEIKGETTTRQKHFIPL